MAAGVASLAAITLVTVAILGTGAYWTYAERVLPDIFWYRVSWANASLWGFWSKLFDPIPSQPRWFAHTIPVRQSPALFRAGTIFSCALVLAVLARATRPRPDESPDRAFGLAVAAMLLVTPVAWEHYFVLLLIPLAVTWVGLPPSTAYQAAFASIVAALWVDPRLIFSSIISGGLSGTARPVHSLTILSFQTYALLGLFAFGVVMATRADEGPPRPTSHPRPPASREVP